MDQDGNIDQVIEKEKSAKSSAGGQKRHTYADDEFGFDWDNEQSAKQNRKQKRREKRKDNSKRRAQSDDKSLEKEQDLTLDINIEGDFRLKTKNMKQIMKQKVAKGNPEKVKEAQIISSDEQSYESESEMSDQSITIKNIQRKFFNEDSNLDYSKIIKDAPKDRSWRDSLNLTQILNNCDSELQQITAFLHSKDLKKVMQKFYKIMGHIITCERIDQFIIQTEKDEAYQSFILEWRNLSKIKKIQQMEEQGWVTEHKPSDKTGIGQHRDISPYQILQIPMRQLMTFKPYIELLTDFLQNNHQDELKTSQELSEMADVSLPWEWFPETRAKFPKRQFHYHMGPTNSGKTRNALEVMRKAETGCYLAPLRLLAMEVHSRLTQGYQDHETGIWVDGLVCDLKTGPKREIFPNSTHLASTIEMLDFEKEYEVAVVDEIQMMSDASRGFNWTNAIMGLKAKEIHVCGDERALNLLNHILEKTEDELIVHDYGRLSRLKTEDYKMSSWSELRTGDCVIGFNVRRLHAMKDEINAFMNTNEEGDVISADNHCALLYGALPPESKIKQVESFNERQGSIKYLLATDAVGMGMNLNIDRVVFSTLTKPFARQRKNTLLEQSMIRQIAGRAGRFTNDGQVSAFNDGELRILRRELKDLSEFQRIRKHGGQFEMFNTYKNLKGSYQVTSEKKFPRLTADQIERQLKKAGIFPPFEQIQAYANKLRNQVDHEMTFSEVLKSFRFAATHATKFFMKNMDEEVMLSDAIEDVPFLTLRERFNFCKAPLTVRAGIKMDYNSKKNSPTFKQKIKKSTLTQYANFVRKFAEGRDQKYYELVLELEKAKFQNSSDVWKSMEEEFNDKLNFNEVNLPECCQLDDSLFNLTRYNEGHIYDLQEIHNLVDCYLWLNMHFPHSFHQIEEARAIKERCCQIIDVILVQDGFMPLTDNQSQEHISEDEEQSQ